MEKTIQLHDKTFTIYIKASQIEEAIEKIAQQINEDIGHKKPIFLVILNGAFLFAADLIRKYSGECEVSFVKLSSYYGTLTTTRVREIIGLENDVRTNGCDSRRYCGYRNYHGQYSEEAHRIGSWRSQNYGFAFQTRCFPKKLQNRLSGIRNSQ